MSYTSVYSVYKTKATCLAELRNSHGSAPAIWDYISIKCTGEKFPMFNPDGFWKLWKDPCLSENERAVLLSTYDMAFVEVEHLERFAVACKEMHEKIISDTKWTWNHFADIGKQAKDLAKKHDYRSLGLGVGCTSVCDPWEQWNFEADKAWGVYSEIAELEGLTEQED